MTQTTSMAVTPTTIDRDKADAYVMVIKAVHQCTEEEAQQRYALEKFSFNRLLEETPSLRECTELSIRGTFLEVISNGMSFDKTAKHVYIMQRSVKSGNAWEKRLVYSEAANGEIYLRLAAGSIKACSLPVIVYEGDVIKIKNVNGQVQLTHEKAIPRKTNNIIGGYCFVTTSIGQDTFWVDIEEIERFKGYSQKANRSQTNPDGKANALYTSGSDGQIDEGFFKTKIAKMALKPYPQKRVQRTMHIEDPEAETETSALQALPAADEILIGSTVETHELAPDEPQQEPENAVEEELLF